MRRLSLRVIMHQPRARIKVFFSLQVLPNKYNVRIIRIYGAADHGNGLIDAMSSFGKFSCKALYCCSGQMARWLQGDL